MDINFLRSMVTAVGFMLFVGIFVWAYRPSRKNEFDEAAQLPFADVTGLDREPKP